MQIVSSLSIPSPFKSSCLYQKHQVQSLRLDLAQISVEINSLLPAVKQSRHLLHGSVHMLCSNFNCWMVLTLRHPVILNSFRCYSVSQQEGATFAARSIWSVHYKSFRDMLSCQYYGSILSVRQYPELISDM